MLFFDILVQLYICQERMQLKLGMLQTVSVSKTVHQKVHQKSSSKKGKNKNKSVCLNKEFTGKYRTSAQKAEEE